jgi:F-type H+-transporting ATPase subunit gamma
MLGQFNEVLAEYVISELNPFVGVKRIWPVGERIAWRLSAPNFEVMPPLPVPDTVPGITPVTGALLSAIEERRERGNLTRVFVFHNEPFSGRTYRCTRRQLLPFDDAWVRSLALREWPTKMIPQVMPVENKTLAAFLREYLFVSLFRACAESLASESASRLAAMQAAERKIGELIGQLHLEYNQARQSSIDEELFDVITGYEAVAHAREG